MPANKKHRSLLYSFIVILALMQIVSFFVMSVQLSKLNASLAVGLEEQESELKQFTSDLVETYDSLYQANFKDISQILAQQQKNFNTEIKLLKSSQSDFSGIVEEAVKSVVTVSTPTSLGTGFIVDEEGYVVTNSHVITGSEENVIVLTFDKKELDAEFIGKDDFRDIALLKIEGTYPALTLADSDEVQVGSKVIAIGNPLGLSFSVTEGIISGLEREGPNNLLEYIQTDVSLNPGNSGGPLINTLGEVVGINNFKIGGAESLGFALESNSLKKQINLLTNDTIIP